MFKNNLEVPPHHVRLMHYQVRTMKCIACYDCIVFTVKATTQIHGLQTVFKRKSDGNTKLNGKNARINRQASELRKNLLRRKEQTRLRAAQQTTPTLTRDGNKSDI